MSGPRGNPLGELCKAVIALEAAWVGMFLFNIFLRELPGESAEGPFMQAFALHAPTLIWKDKWWQLATYMFVHDKVAMLLVNCAGLWVLGTRLEKKLGSANLFWFALGCGVAGAGGSLSLGLILHGMGWGGSETSVSGGLAAVLGLSAAYAIVQGRKTVSMHPVFMLRGRDLAAIVGGLALAVALLVSDGGTAAAVLSGQLLGAAMGAAILLTKPKLAVFIDWRQRVARESYAKHQRETREKVDALLDKVYRTGLDGLKKKELTFLRYASKLYRKHIGKNLRA